MKKDRVLIAILAKNRLMEKKMYVVRLVSKVFENSCAKFKECNSKFENVLENVFQARKFANLRFP